MNIQLDRISEYNYFLTSTFLEDVLDSLFFTTYLPNTDTFSAAVFYQDSFSIKPQSYPGEGVFSSQNLRVNLPNLGLTLVLEGDLIRKETSILDNASTIKAVSFSLSNTAQNYTESFSLSNFSISYASFLDTLRASTENIPDNTDYPLISAANTFNFITALGEATGQSAGNDKISGTNEKDYLFGFAGKDNIKGNTGNDVLDGGSGVDKLTGGAGDDAYYVDNYKDKVIEKIDSGGLDTVYASTSFKVPKGVEKLILSGDANINGYGGKWSDYIEGNSGNNNIVGGQGDDYLKGGYGNDILNGGKGNDALEGGLGADQFIGGKGQDHFHLTHWDMDGDIILDFSRKQGDKIGLPYDAQLNNGVIEDFVFIGSAEFSAAGQVRFDPSTHVLSGNTNADLAADFSVTVYGESNLINSDFVF